MKQKNKNVSVWCPRCKGTGHIINMIAGRQVRIECPDCHGAGIVNEPKEKEKGEQNDMSRM
jgi:DnaJ-class molecular chaperone